MTTPKDAPAHVLQTQWTKWKSYAPCGCTVADTGDISWCPTHAAAPRMKELLERLDRTHEMIGQEHMRALNEARALLRELGEG